MVVKAGGDAALTCGGLPMLSGDESAGASEAAADHMDGCQVGKRYVNEDQSVEVLCVKAGAGSLGADGSLLAIKDAKKLPSSD